MPSGGGPGLPIRLLNVLEKPVKLFFGGAAVAFHHEQEKTPSGSSLQRKIRLGDNTYYLSLARVGSSFTETEQKIFEELCVALAVLYNGFNPIGNPAHFRTAISSSLMDISIARFLRGDRNKDFWKIQNIIQILKKLSFERYEGTPATTGFIVLRGPGSGFKKYLDQNNFKVYQLAQRYNTDENIFSGPLSYRYIDGRLSFFLGKISASNIKLTDIIQRTRLHHRDSIDRLCNQDIFDLINFKASNAFALLLDNKSDIEVLMDTRKVLLWRQGSWSIFDPDIFYEFLGGSLDKSAMDALLSTVYSLSKIRHGSLILIGDLPNGDVDIIKKGSVAGSHLMSQELIRIFKNKSIVDLKKSNELIRILSADGLTVFDSTGRLVETGVITDTSKINTVKVTGGGRTTAAIAASNFGKVIKVSEDGPVELYENEKRIYRFG